MKNLDIKKNRQNLRNKLNKEIDEKLKEHYLSEICEGCSWCKPSIYKEQNEINKTSLNDNKKGS